MNASGLPAGITRAAHTGPRYRTGLRTQTGPLAGGKGLAHMVNYIKLAEGGQPQPSGLASLAAQGTGPDDQLAHISSEELGLLAHMRGGTEINPNTGLPQFGWLGSLLKGLVRAGASIAGGMIGGPAGAAIGSGLATKLTGGSWNDALKGAAMSGIGSWGAQGLSGAGWSPTGVGNPNVTGLGGITGDSVHQTVANSIFQPETELSNAVTGATAAQSLPSFGTQFMNYARSSAGTAGSLGALSTPLESASSAIPVAPPSGPMFSVKPMQRTPRPYTGDLTKYGQGPSHKWYDDINPAPVFGPPGVPGGVDYSGMDTSVPGFADGGNVGLAAPTNNALMQAVQMGYMAAKKGGAAHHGSVRGPGGGQDDLIDAKLSNNEHVVTAREISALGDGDPETGHKRMYSIRSQILKKAGYKNTNPRKQTKPIRGLGNFKISPKVSA